MATRACVISTGAAIGVGSVPWNNSAANRNKINWLPPAQTPFLNADGRTVARPWYLFFQEMAESRMGGIAGATIPQVAGDVTATQAAVVSTASTVTQTIAYARSIDATASALKSVAINNALAGAATVPEPTDPPDGGFTP